MQRRGVMHLSHERIVNLVARERNSFEAKGDNFRWRGWKRRVVADSRQRKRHLALSINIQQAVDGRVHKAAYNFRRKTQCSGDGQQAGEQGAVVPSEMAIGAVLIFPSIAPV